MTHAEARQLARSYLADVLPRRWEHVAGVARRADEVGFELGLSRDTLVSAAWLHDIGYAPDLADTGFHPLDGARALRRCGVQEQVSRLVAHHSCASVEAAERGLLADLQHEFPFETTATSDALWYCDMTVGPSGEPIDVVHRLAEVRSRYGPGHVVTRSLDRAEPALIAAVRRTEQRLQGASEPIS